MARPLPFDPSGELDGPDAAAEEDGQRGTSPPAPGAAPNEGATSDSEDAEALSEPTPVSLAHEEEPAGALITSPVNYSMRPAGDPASVPPRSYPHAAVESTPAHPPAYDDLEPGDVEIVGPARFLGMVPMPIELLDDRVVLPAVLGELKEFIERGTLALMGLAVLTTLLLVVAAGVCPGRLGDSLLLPPALAGFSLAIAVPFYAAGLLGAQREEKRYLEAYLVFLVFYSLWAFVLFFVAIGLLEEPKRKAACASGDCWPALPAFTIIGLFFSCFATTGFVLYLFKFYYFLHEKHGWGDPPPGKAGALEMTGLGPDEAVVLEAL